MTHTKYATLKVDDGSQMDAFVSFPGNDAKYPGILLFQEAFGVNVHIRDVATRIAKEGYVVIAPELYHRTATGFEAPYSDFQSVQPHSKAMTMKGISEDLKAGFEWLQNQDNVLHEKTGSIGFCQGGRISFIANALLPLSASVSFYGGGTDELVSHTAEIHAPHLFFWGGLDKHIPREQRETIITAMETAGKQYVAVTFSYAGHGFFCNERTSYQPDAAKEAWEMTLAFFRNKLQ